MKCVLEELSESTLVMFTYESPDATHLNIKLYDPSGAEIYGAMDQVGVAPTGVFWPYAVRGLALPGGVRLVTWTHTGCHQPV
jgi:hypothetical protein